MNAHGSLHKQQLLALIIPILTIAISLAVTAPTSAQAKENQVPFGAAPSEIRQFLIKAEAADKIEDPLARCHAFPDLPGNKWPVGLAEAHCEFVYGPRITIADAKKLFESGELEKLDSLFAADLEKHFSKDNFSEVIHRDFEDFESNYEAGKFTMQWLEKAPDSAYALTARGSYYANMAWEARGTKYASDTADENLERMSEFASLAIEHFQRALKIEPRLLEAHARLINIAMVDSRPEVEAKAFRDAKRIDPACNQVSMYQLWALAPRWGGSYEEMVALSKELEPYLAQRPLLVNRMLSPVADRGDRLYATDQEEEAIKVLRPILPYTTNYEAFENTAQSMTILNKQEDRWHELMYYLEAGRFKTGKYHVNRKLGRLLLLHAKRPVWAMKYLKLAVKLGPDDAYSHYLLAASYLNSGNNKDAETHYLISMKTPKYRQDSMLELTSSYMRSNQPAKAFEQIQILNKEYPAFAEGWLYTGAILSDLKKPGANEAYRKFLETVDRSDPLMRERAEELERYLKDVRALPSSKK